MNNRDKIGDSIGHYQITASLGAGGMGEVYRARDTRLGREVAIKFLTADYAESADGLRRFEQEARTLAALNHPNILVVHDTGVHEGAPYFVSELLEGQTLREVLGGAQLPLRKAIEYALQIAQGLAAAHSKGVIHRDLKPENLFVTQDGRVKILDFGLAKLKRVERGSELRVERKPSPTTTDSQLSTQTPLNSTAPTLLESTQPGLVLGTPSYMSPEQVRGEAADHRSDIFAFGAILYEMLSGQRAFRRDTPVETMNAILKEEPPDSIVALANASPALERVVERCLEKSPDRRFQSASDLAFALENLSVTSRVSPLNAQALDAQAGANIRRALPWAIAALLAVALAFLLLNSLRDSSRIQTRQNPTVRKLELRFPPPNRMESADPVVRYLVISPDGNKLAYVNDEGLWILRLERMGPPELLRRDEDLRGLFWSATSEEIAYFKGENLFRVPISGGQPNLICRAPTRASPLGGGGVWLGDGRIIFATGWLETGLYEVSAKGGNAAPLPVSEEPQVWIANPSPLPGGGVVFVVRSQGGDVLAAWTPQHGLKNLWTSPGERLSKPAYSPTGHIIFARPSDNPGIWAFAFSYQRLERAGEPFLISAQGHSPSVAGDGTLVLNLSEPALRQLVWVDRNGRVTGTIGPPKPGLGMARLSLDETRVAASSTRGYSGL
ncbi:MAG: hypothetical protein FJ398_10325 [Verrucomicrobia bacterium]|nr:hypothetical protein [Verrucomicrobiota bacterium]